MPRTKPTGSATVAEKAVAKMMKAAAPLIAEADLRRAVEDLIGEGGRWPIGYRRTI